MRKTKFSEVEEQKIIQQYWTPLPNGTWIGSTTIALEWGVSPTTIHNILRRHGMPQRSSQEAYRNGKRTKPIKNLPTGSPPLCQCGCGNSTAWNQHKNGWNAYVEGHYHSAKTYHDRQWLHNAYIVERRSAEDIAREFGVAGVTVTRNLRRVGIEVRDAKESKIGVFAGAKNASWKGGVTPERQRLYKTQQWRQLVRFIFERDQFRCQRCGVGQASKHHLHAHHIKPWADNEQLRFETTNLITLCRDCHLWVHSLANTEKQFLS